MEKVFALASSIAALAFAYYLSYQILKEGEGTERMRELYSAIRSGAMAFLRREFKVLSVFVIVMVLVLAVFISPYSALAYALGAVASGLAAFFGMNIATKANVRTANAAISSYARALRVSFSAGAVMGFYVVGFGLLGLVILYWLFPEGTKIWLAYAFGSTSTALFFRVGGGVFTKSADVGADLVGKVEKGIPEDDPRNPAVIADNVGDNVGDVAGMGSDLCESYISAIAAAMVLGLAAKEVWGLPGVTVPLIMASAGILVSIIGALLTRPTEVRGSFELQVAKAMQTMNRGIYIANILAILVCLGIVLYFWGFKGMNIFWPVVIGLACGFVIGKVAEYYTAAEKSPAQGIAKASQSGPGITIIEGISVGMISTLIPIVAVAIATLLSYYFAGLYGIAIASLGMLLTLGIVLASDCYGPIADNSAGIAQMAGLGHEVRSRTEALDAVGNTTAAIGKGFAIGSAALAALAWLATYFEVANLKVVSLTAVEVVVGILIGSLLVFFFCALALKGVAKAAFLVVEEVRRQWREIKGLWEGTAKPDYVKCVDLATKNAINYMLTPGIVVIVVPLLLGFTLGPESVAGLLLGALATGYLVAVMMANSGGAWDNAKKFIEAGHLGGKGSETHKAAVIGDTVGDPLKDTAGPSLNILIKLVGKVAVIFAPLFILFGL